MDKNKRILFSDNFDVVTQNVDDSNVEFGYAIDFGIIRSKGDDALFGGLI